MYFLKNISLKDMADNTKLHTPMAICCESPLETEPKLENMFQCKEQSHRVSHPNPWHFSHIFKIQFETIFADDSKFYI